MALKAWSSKVAVYADPWAPASSICAATVRLDHGAVSRYMHTKCSITNTGSPSFEVQSSIIALRCENGLPFETIPFV